MNLRRFLSLLSLSACLASCQSAGLGGPDHSVYETEWGQEVLLQDMAVDLAEADVVFLGEEHDNDVGHRLQLETLAALIELRPNVILTLEQFEADIQGQVDLYMAGAIEQETLLKTSRPWPNYVRHYAPIIELAKENGVPVIAANIPRPVARRIAYEGRAVQAEEWMAPPIIWIDEPEYAERFARAMGRDSNEEYDQGLERWFTAQCAKDEAMARSIAQVLVRAWNAGEKPLVVHLNGKFHSDHYLGTVSRLLRRHPRLDVRVVGMNSDEDRSRTLSADEMRQGDYVWLVKPQPE
jgi:uncharacterized iron-regulated protein